MHTTMHYEKVYCITAAIPIQKQELEASFQPHWALQPDVSDST
jgi:hypothetical protein